jgi:hypothetical protein
MKVEELIGSKVWIKREQFRSVPGGIEGMSNAVNLDDIKSSVSQSRFRIEMPFLETLLRSPVPIFQRLIMPAISRKAVQHKPRRWRGFTIVALKVLD